MKLFLMAMRFTSTMALVQRLPVMSWAELGWYPKPEVGQRITSCKMNRVAQRRLPVHREISPRRILSLPLVNCSIPQQQAPTISTEQQVDSPTELYSLRTRYYNSSSNVPILTASVGSWANGQDSFANQNDCQPTYPVHSGQSPIRRIQCWTAPPMIFFT